MSKSAEQRARDLLERYGVEGAQAFSAGDVVELANLIARADWIGEPPFSSEWSEHMRSLLGESVSVVIDRDRPVVITGTLLSYNEGGEVAIREGDGFVTWSWPALEATKTPPNGYAAEIRLEMTCGACPEQYDAFLGDRQVGYLRLRHGQFTVRVPDAGGALVYDAAPSGDGIFDESERDYYLEQARRAIAASFAQD